MLIFDLILILLFGPIQAEAPPLFHVKNGNMTLSQNLQQLVLTQHRDFELVQTKQFSKNAKKNSKGHPMAITGDFNGDRIKDLAFSGYSRREKKFYYYAALSSQKDNKYSLKIVDQHTINKDQSLKEMTTYLTLGKAKVIKAKRDTVQIESDSTTLMSVEPFYYSLKHKRFQPFRGKMD